MSAGFGQIAAAAWGYWLWALIVPLYFFTLLRGDSSARTLVGLMAIAAFLGDLLNAARPAWASTESLTLGADIILLAALVTVALRSSRIYPLVIASAQLLVVIVEAYATAGIAGRTTTLEAAFTALAFVQFWAFAFGLANHRSHRPIWQIRRRRENASGELAPRVNDAR